MSISNYQVIQSTDDQRRPVHNHKTYLLTYLLPTAHVHSAGQLSINHLVLKNCLFYLVLKTFQIFFQTTEHPFQYYVE